MSLASDARAIARAGIRAVDPSAAVQRTIRRRGRRLQVGDRRLTLSAHGRIHVVAIGKAAGAMADSAIAAVGDAPAGLVVTPRGYPGPRARIPVAFGNHPVPEAASFRAGTRLLRAVASTAPEDLILYLISGGGSAAAEVPADDLRAEDLTRTTEQLLGSGAPISEMNAIRRHLSGIKGGRLALAGVATQFATIAMSDVVGDPPPDIASGPTVGDPTTFQDALASVRRWGLDRRLPTTVLRHLRAGARGARVETPKPTEPRLRAAPFVLAGTNRVALDAGVREARRRGYAAALIDRPLVGDTRRAARAFGRSLFAGSTRRPRALLAGGETTVTLGPHSGRGGRNQEFALVLAELLAGRPALVLSVGTDGIDGPTDAAGGFVDGRTAERALAVGVDLEDALARHASYAALERLGGLWRTGPTGTNVMDLHVGLLGPRTSRGTAGSSRPGAAPSSRRRRS